MKPDLAKLRELAERATPGPWRVETADDRKTSAGYPVVEGIYGRETWVDYGNGAERHDPRIVETDSGVYEPKWNDAAYIAATSPDVVVTLLDEIERLRELHPRSLARETIETYRKRQEDYEETCTLLRKQLATAHRELERRKHGVQIEGDYVCPDSPALTECRKELAAMTAENERLRVRQQELLATIVRVTNETPFSDEAKDALAQRGRLVAEIGTLRQQADQLFNALDEAIGLADTPEHNQDEEWDRQRKECGRVCDAYVGFKGAAQ